MLSQVVLQFLFQLAFDHRLIVLQLLLSLCCLTIHVFTGCTYVLWFQDKDYALTCKLYELPVFLPLNSPKGVCPSAGA